MEEVLFWLISVPVMVAFAVVVASHSHERGNMGMPPPRPIRPRRDTSVDTNLIYDIHKAYPLNRPPNEELDIIIRPSLDGLLENFMLAVGTLLLTFGKTRASKVCAYITGGIFFQIVSAPLFGIDVLSVQEWLPLGLTCIIGLVFGLAMTHKRKPYEPDYTDFFPLRSSVVPYQSSPPQGGSALASGKLTTQEAADALATLVSPNSYVEPYTPPMRYLASVEEDMPVLGEEYADDGKAIPGDDEWQQLIVFERG